MVVSPGIAARLISRLGAWRRLDSERAAKWAMLGAVLLAAAIAVAPSAVDPDLWGHVRYGRDVLAHGLPTFATYTYTATDFRWVNHENLSEVVLALVADHLGARGLLIGKCLLGVSIVASMMRAALRRGLSLATAAAAALLVSVNLSYHWSARPQVLGFVCFAAMISLLAWCFAGWEGTNRFSRQGRTAPLEYSSKRLKALWLAPFIFVVWTNAHGGFLAGVCIYSTYLAFRTVEAWLAFGRAAYGVSLRFGLMIVVAWLATLLNPYGPTLISWLVADIWAPRPEILDWRAPGLFDPLYLPLWIMAAATIAAFAFTKRSRDVTQLIILAIVFWQATLHQRHIPFFAILFGYWAPVHIESALRRLRRATQSVRQAPSIRKRIAFAIVMAAVYSLLLFRLAGRLSEMPVPKNEYPVAAMQFIADHGLTGKAVIAFNWAQYAIEAVGPSRPDAADGLLVACDGRLRTCYPQEIIDYHFDFFLGPQGGASPSGSTERYRDPASPPFVAERTLKYGRPDLVLIDRRQSHATATMEKYSADWRLLYQDRLAQLWGRAAVYDDPASKEFLPESHRRISDERQFGSVVWPALPSRTFTK